MGRVRARRGGRDRDDEGAVSSPLSPRESFMVLVDRDDIKNVNAPTGGELNEAIRKGLKIPSTTKEQKNG